MKHRWRGNGGYKWRHTLWVGDAVKLEVELLLLYGGLMEEEEDEKVGEGEYLS